MKRRNLSSFLCIFLLITFFSGCRNKITTVSPEEPANVFSCSFQGIKRRFSVFLPEEKPEGFILMLHGYGESISSFRNKTFMDKYALPAGYAVCYVSSGNEPGWNYGIPSSRKNDEKFLPALADYLKEIYGNSRSKTFLCGFSNGAFMTGTMAIKFPRNFDGYICVEGLPTLAAWNKRKAGANFMVVYGTKDDLIPFRSAEKNVQYNFPFIEDLISHFENSGAIFEAVEIPNGRHQWPESRTTGYEIDELILDFCRTCSSGK